MISSAGSYEKNRKKSLYNQIDKMAIYWSSIKISLLILCKTAWNPNITLRMCGGITLNNYCIFWNCSECWVNDPPTAWRPTCIKPLKTHLSLRVMSSRSLTALLVFWWLLSLNDNLARFLKGECDHYEYQRIRDYHWEIFKMRYVRHCVCYLQRYHS